MEIRAAKPSEKAYRMYDEHGLYLDVWPSGNKIWRFKYRFSGKENTLTLGSYPIISVKDARIKRDEARRMIYEDADPAFRRKEVIANPSFAVTFRNPLKRQ
ncbi:MAG: Arm DNA-binding domain-containing protein [Synergistaceae bacterium]|nr:Arm DNA-binding domain-containing protein [Synergistaceae bacterium]